MILRLDAGFGSDDNLNWAIDQGYQICAKGYSGKRAGQFGHLVQDWTVVVPNVRWVALSPRQLQFCRPTRTIAVRWQADKKLKHALYIVTDLDTPLVTVCQVYSLRGGAEVDIRDDKQGLLLTHRRKRSFHAQEMLILLNDLAHDLLVAFRRTVLTGTPLTHFGPYRLINEALNIPGEALCADGCLSELRLLDTHPHAVVMADALSRFW